MGAHRITRNRLKEQIRARRNMLKRANIDGTKVTVTVLQDELTKEVKGVAISREVAIQWREKNGWDNAELIDFAIEV